MKKGLLGFLFGVLYLLLYVVAANVIAVIYTVVVTVQMSFEWTSDFLASGMMPTEADIFELTRQAIETVLEKTAMLTVVGSAFAVVVFVVMALIRKRSIQREFWLFRFSPKTILPVVLIGVGLNIVVTFVIGLLPISDAYMEQYEELFMKIETGNPVWFVLMTVVTAPIVEELVFRGFAYTRFKRGMPIPVAMALSSLIFGLFHGFTVQIVYATLIGVLLVWVFEKTQSIFPSILLHMSFNGTSLILARIYGEQDTVTGILVPLIAVLATIAGVVIFQRQSPADKRKTIDEEKEERKLALLAQQNANAAAEGNSLAE